MKRAVILGGTGVLGRAIAWRLIRAGWAVDMTGRDRSRMPADLAAAGARFIAAERRDDAALAGVMAGGADLLVDAVCYTDADARQLLPHLAAVSSAVMLSSKAVYVDAAGNHVNSDVPPRFDAPILESNPTMRPGTVDYHSREGYWQEVLLDDSAPAGLGDHPWDFRPPLVLSTKASLAYEPVGTYAQTIPHQVDWLVKAAAAGAMPGTGDPSLKHYLDYSLEEQFTAGSTRRTH
ncbi:hypothetical protein SAMN05660473_03176 [Arthrobacter sp. 49Tsu3.1M3]|uniref:hypothetical protein n=1 Tax=Arthrobacter sp. 49Tsu3.1M3 TaxID=1279029 RepID=UPI0009A8B304|nr:hypothetical protein [Arthrobacter sp. 49Tsu3.1M3]SKB94043.1 hypothetical protein SAMN05660473_03176 [Arthrobacter sp. 49Tsu3.1M3]